MSSSNVIFWNVWSGGLSVWRRNYCVWDSQTHQWRLHNILSGGREPIVHRVGDCLSPIILPASLQDSRIIFVYFFCWVFCFMFNDRKQTPADIK